MPMMMIALFTTLSTDLRSEYFQWCNMQFYNKTKLRSSIAVCGAILRHCAVVVKYWSRHPGAWCGRNTSWICVSKSSLEFIPKSTFCSAEISIRLIEISCQLHDKNVHVTGNIIVNHIVVHFSTSFSLSFLSIFDKFVLTKLVSKFEKVENVFIVSFDIYHHQSIVCFISILSSQIALKLNWVLLFSTDPILYLSNCHYCC